MNPGASILICISASKCNESISSIADNAASRIACGEGGVGVGEGVGVGVGVGDGVGVGVTVAAGVGEGRACSVGSTAASMVASTSRLGSRSEQPVSNTKMTASMTDRRDAAHMVPYYGSVHDR